MKTILVAIDFSKNAEHALEYAVLFANKLNACIHLIWVDNTLIEESVIDIIEGETRIEKRSYMNSIIKKFQPQVQCGEIQVLLRKGRVYQEISKAAKQINADMIFAGTHGVSGYEQYWIGSNANRIVSQAPCPVVTIRSDYEFKDSIKNILLPLDSSLETKQKLPFAADLAKKFNATIHLLKIFNTPLSVIRKRIDKYGEDAIACLKEEKVKFVNGEIEADNVAASIIKYSRQNKIDLISIMTDQDTTTANKFLGPYAQQLINNSEIPVLSLRSKEIRD
ncbi:MAG: universal stress protein [Bacteroidetes bacterium]|nr:universal stress protein [Bacteroidota bacterium]